MSEVIGTVIDNKNNTLLIEVKRDACETCTEHSHCRLIEKNESTIISVDMEMAQNATLGDRVVIETGASKIIGLSLLLYAFPVFSVLIFTIAGNYMFKAENAGLITGMIGGIIAFLIIYIIDRKIGKKLKHKITRVIK